MFMICRMQEFNPWESLIRTHNLEQTSQQYYNYILIIAVVNLNLGKKRDPIYIGVMNQVISYKILPVILISCYRAEIK